MSLRAGGIAGIEPAPSAAPARAPAPSASPGAQTAESLSGPVAVARGELGYVDAIHNGTGAVRLVRTGDVTVLRFENRAITNAPDVHVYLSRETGGKWGESTSVYLGPLKAINGSFNHTAPADIELSLYKGVIVWRQQFSVLVTLADLR
jgi:hypothetical protein